MVSLLCVASCDVSANKINVVDYSQQNLQGKTLFLAVSTCWSADFKICVCGSCFTGCLFAENVERAGIFQKAMKKANGDKMLEQAYLREYRKYFSLTKLFHMFFMLS